MYALGLIACLLCLLCAVVVFAACAVSNGIE